MTLYSENLVNKKKMRNKHVNVQIERRQQKRRHSLVSYQLLPSDLLECCCPCWQYSIFIWYSCVTVYSEGALCDRDKPSYTEPFLTRKHICIYVYLYIYLIEFVV